MNICKLRGKVKHWTQVLFNAVINISWHYKNKDTLSIAALGIATFDIINNTCHHHIGTRCCVSVFIVLIIIMLRVSYAECHTFIVLIIIIPIVAMLSIILLLF